jgi:hypothetical protein
MDWTWFGLGFGAVAIVLILLPPRYDPAIRLKMWLDRK